MAPAHSLLPNVAQIDRQLVVGDSINHPTLGIGVLIAGWEGYLKVEFSSGLSVFTDKDNFRLIPSDQKGDWMLLGSEQAEEWLAEVARQRKSAVAEARLIFRSDFIRSDDVFEKKLSHYLPRRIYEHEKASFVQRWVERTVHGVNGNKPKIPDAEQALAISSVLGHVQVVARAGSGKTETVANRAVFLHKYCGVAPNEMLLLAFNKDAAKEMSERVAMKSNGGILPHIMTFHALAYAIANSAKQLLLNQNGGGDQSLNQTFQQVLMDAIENPDFEERVRCLMLAHFRADWEKIVSGGFSLGREEMLAFRRSLASETLRGEYVKSYGEKVIANFLFEHDVPYFYEQNHWWSGRNYRPDFTIPQCGSMPKGVIVEYFGMQGDPDYDKQSAEKRAYWAKKSSDWVFIALGPEDILVGGHTTFEEHLADVLIAVKVPVVRLSEDEIWQRARVRSISRFTEAVSGFVGRCRKKWITADDLRILIAEYQALSEIEEWFIDIAVELYTTYLARLEATDSEDFDGLMQEAVSLIAGGTSRFFRKAGDGDLKHLRYIFVDEYQDFTELFHRLISAIRQLNPDVELFCVGDDWQAINRFAGSDLKYYEQFASIFSPSARLGIATNRRSAQSVVIASNALMKGKGDPAISSSIEVGLVALVDLAKFKPTSLEESLFNKSLLTPVVLRLAGKALAEGKSVVLLSAKNDLIDPSGGKTSLGRYLKSLKLKLPIPLRDGLSISTAHGFKGNESDVVIILDALDRNYPLIHPNWVFSRILGESIEAIVDESRRLFYVALTRAKEKVYIVTEESRKSPFLDEIAITCLLPEVVWSQYPPVVANSDWVTVKVGGDYEAIQPLIATLKADGFRYRDLSRSGGQRSWDQSFRTSELEDDFLVDSPWMIFAREHGLSGVGVRFFDGLERRLMSCNVRNGELMLTVATDSRVFHLAHLKAAMGPSDIAEHDIVDAQQ